VQKCGFVEMPEHTDISSISGYEQTGKAEVEPIKGLDLG